MATELTIGPILFHWSAERKRDFYFRIADEAPVETVYVGEVVCAKRVPFFEHHYPEVADRLRRGGKKVVFSTLAEVMIPHERQITAGICDLEDYIVEANDAAALFHLRDKPHAVGPFVNVYNEDTLAVLAGNGGVHFCLPPELPSRVLAAMGEKAEELGVTLETQVYGRIPLALSARCYHARAHGRVKDNCQFVCERDSDGMPLETLDGAQFLAVNGVQTLSHACLNLLAELTEMQAAGIQAFRLSPHSHDMIGVADVFRSVINGGIAPEEGAIKLREVCGAVSFCDGFYHAVEGFRSVCTGGERPS